MIACELYCEFDVPLDVYGDFVTAVDEAQAEEAEAAAYAEAEAAAASAPAQSRKAERHGWNKAVAILENSAAAEDKKIEDEKKSGDEVEAAIEQPDEQVDVVIDDAPVSQKRLVSALEPFPIEGNGF